MSATPEDSGPPPEPARPPWRAALGSTGAPLEWPLVFGAVLGGTVGALAAWPLGSVVGMVFAGIVAGLSGAVALGAPPAAAARSGILAVIATTTTTALAGLTTGRPVLAALSMLLVAVLTSAAFAAGAIGPVLGLMGAFAYLGAAIVGVLLRAVEVPTGRLIGSILLGSAAGAVLAAVVGTVRRRRAGADRVRPTGPSPWRQIATSLRTVDEHTRDGVRRGIALGLAMLFFQTTTDRNTMWVFLGAYLVLLPTGRDPLLTALVRVVGTLFGVIAVGLLAAVLPTSALIALALVALLGSLLYSQRQPTLSAALSAAAATLLVGAPSGTVPEWAGQRLLDTAIGCGLALLAGYLLWPGDTFRRPPTAAKVTDPAP